METWSEMKRRLAIALLLLAGCGRGKFEIGMNVGPAGADIARMTASEIRQSQVAKDRRVDVRVAVQRAMVENRATPEMFALALDSMANDEDVAVIVSRFLDKETLAAIATLRAQQVPFLATTPLPDGTLRAGGPGFAMVPGYGEQARFLAQQAKPSDQIAIVHIDNAYGEGLSAALGNALQTAGVSVADVRRYEQSWDEPRMVALGTDLQQTKHPTLVYFIGRAPSLELIWQPFRDAGTDVRVLGSDLVESPAVYDNPEGRFTGLRYVRYFDPKSVDNERMKDLHDRYAMWAMRGEMTGEIALIYDAMMLTGEALRSGARTRAEINRYFSELGVTRPAFQGVTGPIAFTADGSVARKLELAEVTNRGVVKAEDQR